MSYTGFKYDLVDLAEASEEPSSLQTPGPSFGRSKLLEAIDLLIFSFDEFSCRYNDGFVYEWHDESVMTFKKRGTVREYLNELCGNKEYREVMTNQLNSLVSFLENNPTYQGIRSLQIDLNIIEVCNFDLKWLFIEV